METLHHILFGIYPYIALATFLVGSVLTYNHKQRRWGSKSSQLLEGDRLRMASILFHSGILLLFFGHLVGLLTPPELFHALGISAAAKQQLAMTAGGIFGTMCLIGLAMLIHRRMTNRRVYKNSSGMDIFILWLLLATLLLGLVTIPVSASHPEGHVMEQLMHWAQAIVTLRPASHLLLEVSFLYKLHILFGLTVFLVFPFSRLVHIWSAPVGYINRPYQLVRRRVQHT
ncbi:nitrate reductase [Thiohalorhabdus denitrificans]|uniref:nitrate reductase (quinone) n=1 Tax=Thiohalorhabdus denitrificans TaxID=381306 RepID=A0A0P9CWS0_9GAMM|nr:respiratory nitrate reductase subunit gamma [Thiohalorhabdus denitrificans]KPV41236.1 nitrate reductase [Thiohalorhabdus denitrificans]SCY35030.1 nitrate reductase gamma subunit [Thiohalorhabdus denitrificans]